MSETFTQKVIDGVIHHKNPEIQTSEDMIKQLENKVDKNFLKKVEAISAEAKKSSKNEWEELREKLTDDEKSTIKKECPDAAKKLEKADASPEKKEGMSTKAKAATVLAAVGGAGAIAAVVGNENAEKLEKAGEKAEGFLAKIEGFFDKISTYFTSMWNGIQLAIATKFPTIAKMFGIKAPKVEDIANNAKWAAEEVAENAVDKAKEVIKDPIEKAKKDLMDQIQREYHVDFKNSKKREKFEKIWNKHNESIGKTYQERSNDPNRNTWDWAAAYTVDSTEFLLDLVNEGIIPTAAIRASVIQGWKMMLRFTLASAEKLVGVAAQWWEAILAEISMDRFGQIYSNLDAWQKAAVAHILLDQGILLNAIAGKCAFALSEVYVVAATWDERLGWKGVESAWFSALGKHDKVAEQLQKVIDIVDEWGSTSEAARALRSSLSEQMTKFAISDAFMRSWEDLKDFRVAITDLKAKDSSIVSQEILESIEKSLSENIGRTKKDFANELARNIKNSFTEEMLNGTGVRWWAKFKSLFTGPVGNTELMVDETIRQGVLIDEWLAKSIQESNPAVKTLRNIMNGLTIHEYPIMGNCAMAVIKAEKAEEVMKNIQRLQIESPKLLEGLFGGLTIAVAVSAGYQLEEQNKAWGITKALLTLMPFVGAGILIYDGGQLKNNKFEHISYMATGTGMAVFDSYRLLRIMGRPDKVVELTRFFGGPITEATKFASSASQLTFASGSSMKWMYKLITAVDKKPIIELMSKQLRWVAALLTLYVAWMCIWDRYKAKNEEEMIAELKKQKIIDEEGQFDLGKIKEMFTTLHEEKKRKVIDVIVASVAGEHGANTIEGGEGAPYTVHLENTVGVDAKEAIEKQLHEFGIIGKVDYSPSAIKAYAKKIMEAGVNKETFVHLMDRLGVPGADMFWKGGSSAT